MMTAGGWMNIIPEKILVRIHPRRALGRINSVDEIVMCRLAQDADHIEPDIQVVNIDGDGEITATEGKRVIDDGSVLCAVFGRRAAKRVIGSSIEAVLRDR